MMIIDEQVAPIQRRPQPSRPVQRRQQPQQPQQPPPQPKQPTPNYVQMDDGSPVKVSRKQFSNPLQRKLEAIMAAHDNANAARDQEREQKIENIQRKMESGELKPTRRRGSIDVDYVSTDSLIRPDERDKVQAQRKEAKSPDTTDAVDQQTDDDNQWFDEIPDDDADIDSMAGFESSDDDIHRMPDDLPRFDPSSLEEDNADDMGELESGYADDYSQPAVTTDAPIQRQYDDDYPAQDFDALANDNNIGSTDSQTPIQRAIQDYDGLPTFDDFDQDETVPLIPSVDFPSASDSPSTGDTPIQRSSYDEPQYDGEPEFDAYDDGADYADTPKI